ncbi:T9SS type A sorting domain-containing protein [Xanthomarina sp. GH4-25]|uniref:T9SS type A sorting domain-containing protein n=1 Tax=Xanthomarina sp. GH4-25 TaxID=3349335 RepID=UPI000D6836A5|nr:hypothetical protein DI383_13195 [Flavobacteriaceae bacterium LYZ1037]
MKTLNYYFLTIALCFSAMIQAQVSDSDIPENGFVYNEDLIVQGSECVGVDCPTAPSFGFHTLRLMENNLRIHFDDTSNSASFPGNDWEITINDSDNGGANYFGVSDLTAGNMPFRISAGVGANALYVGTGGNVGLGTDTPVVELQVTDGDSPTLRLEQNGASGWTAQTWDLAGNETNFFIRDVTNGSLLPFKIKPGAPNNSFFIAANGTIGLGTQGPNLNASLDLSATDKGLILNRLTTAQRTTLSSGAVAGMTVYDTDDNVTYYWNGTEWVNTSQDNQDLTSATLSGTTLTVAIESGASVDVDLAPILADLQAENTAQQAQIDDLLARVTAIEQCACGGTLGVMESVPTENNIRLNQNVPNPFNTLTNIKYYIPIKYHSAKIVVTSSLGQVIYDFPLNTFGKEGSLDLSKSNLQSAIYYYTLYVDGKKIDTKRLVTQ